MGNVSKSVISVFKKAGKASTNYPAVILDAILFSLITIIRINLDWPAQEANNFLLNTLQMSFGLGVLFSMAAITFAQSRMNTKQAFLMANLLGVAFTILSFVLLFFFGGIIPEKIQFETRQFKILHPLAVPRVLAAGFVSSLAFVVFAGYPPEKSDVSKALFMTIKAFFIALVYGLVIMAGASGVAGAIQGLLYPEMSTKIYQYIATISGFVGFTIFVGYFPDFRKGSDDPHREVAQSQSRFIVGLLDFILVPIMLALTLVLILWAGRTVLNGMNTEFVMLYGIATTYAIGGILLHILVTHSESAAAKLYKRVFPIAVLFILLFEAWALYLQLGKFGIKPTEYLFIVILIIAFISSILLIWQQKKAHQWIIYVTSIAVIIMVLPVVGFGDLPVVFQVNHLEQLLTKENMLRDNKIIPATTTPDQSTRVAMTDSVDFLINLQNVTYPQWLDKEALALSFDQVMGFPRTFPNEDPNNPINPTGIYLSLEPGVIDISGYQWELGSSLYPDFRANLIKFTGNKGKYEFQWTGQEKGNLTNLTASKDGIAFNEVDLKPFFDQLAVKYASGSEAKNIPLSDMSIKFESSQGDLLIIFNNIEVRKDAVAYYSYGIRLMLFNEK